MLYTWIELQLLCKIYLFCTTFIWHHVIFPGWKGKHLFYSHEITGRSVAGLDAVLLYHILWLSKGIRNLHNSAICVTLSRMFVWRNEMKNMLIRPQLIEKKTSNECSSLSIIIQDWFNLSVTSFIPICGKPISILLFNYLTKLHLLDSSSIRPNCWFRNFQLIG